ncbi:hypothetical protein BWZ22_00220 [Seonamhaeicola sp. S2-3]|nr:hypothetical protein BWZ22_00220 [Seonamhaeicola sp. S2-3]
MLLTYVNKLNIVSYIQIIIFLTFARLKSAITAIILEELKVFILLGIKYYFRSFDIKGEEIISSFFIFM